VPLRTFSVRFEDVEFDEGVFQRQLVSGLDTRHTELICTNADICAAFPKTIWHTESPLLRTAATPLMLLSEKVRASGYKVILTGEGADEIMAGYDLFKEAKIRRFCARNPKSTMRPALFRRLYPYLSHSPGSSRVYAHKFFGQGMERLGQPYFSHIPRWRTTHRLWQFFSRDALNTLGDWNQFLEIEKILPEAIRDWEPLNQDQYVEAHTLLSGYLLCSQGDRVCSANGVEGRFPFLDHRVIEFCNNLPARFKLMGLKEKYLLKKAARGWIPETIRARVKQPYRAPDSKSFFKQGESAEYVAELFSEPRIRDAGYFDVNTTRKLFEKCRRGHAIGFSDNMAFIGIFSTMLLDELFIRPSDKEKGVVTQSNALYGQEDKVTYAA
jgi:asparagine synthase (glutamine-hydrolysing)